MPIFNLIKTIGMNLPVPTIVIGAVVLILLIIHFTRQTTQQKRVLVGEFLAELVLPVIIFKILCFLLYNGCIGHSKLR